MTVLFGFVIKVMKTSFFSQFFLLGIIKRDFKIVYQPKVTPRKRYFICVSSLISAVGSDNAFTAFKRALNSDADKCRVKLRKCGIIDFYRK